MDTWALAHGIASIDLLPKSNSWFFVTADYSFGHELQSVAAETISSRGGSVVGSARHPINTSDFASFLLQAQNAKADIVGLANAGLDLTNSMKQAREFGLSESKTFVAFAATINNIRELGLHDAQGLLIPGLFDWDLNDGTRAWSMRFQDVNQHQSRPPPGESSNALKIIEKIGSRWGRDRRRSGPL